jgi:hypothetical protein
MTLSLAAQRHFEMLQNVALLDDIQVKDTEQNDTHGIWHSA